MYTSYIHKIENNNMCKVYQFTKLSKKIRIICNNYIKLIPLRLSNSSPNVINLMIMKINNDVKLSNDWYSKDKVISLVKECKYRFALQLLKSSTYYDKCINIRQLCIEMMLLYLENNELYQISKQLYKYYSNVQDIWSKKDCTDLAREIVSYYHKKKIV